MLHLHGDTFAILAISCLIFYGLKSKIVSFIREVKGFSPLGVSESGEVRLLLCHSEKEVFPVDTQTLETTHVLKVEGSERIHTVCTNSFESELIIGVWTDTKVRFFRYKAPWNRSI